MGLLVSRSRRCWADRDKAVTARFEDVAADAPTFENVVSRARLERAFGTIRDLSDSHWKAAHKDTAADLAALRTAAGTDVFTVGADGSIIDGSLNNAEQLAEELAQSWDEVGRLRSQLHDLRTEFQRWINHPTNCPCAACEILARTDTTTP